MIKYVVVGGGRMKIKLFFLALFFVLIDQGSKLCLLNYFHYLDTMSIIPNFFSITYIQNQGAAFGILQGNLAFFIGITILFLAYLMKTIVDDKEMYGLKVAYYSMILAGIIGNLIDRIGRGYVIDMFSFQFGTYQFPVFNVADICIVVGVFLLSIDVIRSEVHVIKSRRRNKNR